MGEVSGSTWVFLVLSCFALLTVSPQVTLLFSILTGFARSYKYLLPFSEAFKEKLFRPIVASLTLLYLYLLVRVIPWPDSIDVVVTILLKTIGVISIFVSFWTARRFLALLEFVARYLVRYHLQDPLLMSFTSDVIVYTRLALVFFIGYFLLIALFALIELQSVFWTLLELLTTYNLLSIMVAVVFVGPLREALTGITILVDGILKYGDWIEINQVCGKVNAVGVLQVELIQADHSSIFIPCSEFLYYDVCNLSERKYRQVFIEICNDEIPLILPDQGTREGALRDFVKRMERIVSILGLLNWCVSLDEKTLRITWDIPAGNLHEFVKQKTIVMLDFTSELEKFNSRMASYKTTSEGFSFNLGDKETFKSQTLKKID